MSGKIRHIYEFGEFCLEPAECLLRKGSITGEHNDGIVRTPYLHKMYSEEVLSLFRKTKDIFDPKNIFNPGKKVGGSIDYMCSHIAIETTK